jgi:hypothetical protein
MRLNCKDQPQLSKQTCDQAAHSRSTLNCELNQLPPSHNFTICLHNSNTSRSNIPLVDLTRPLDTHQLLLISHDQPPFPQMTHVVVTGPHQIRTSESCLALQVSACNVQAHLFPSHRLNRRRRRELTLDFPRLVTIAEDNTALVQPSEEAKGRPGHLLCRALIQCQLSTDRRAALQLLLLDLPHGHRLGLQTSLEGNLSP